MKNSVDNNTTSTPFPKEQLLKDIKEFLEIQSKGLYFIDTYKEDMTSQQLFTSTNEQFNNSNYNPNSSIGLEDSSLTFVPTVKVGQTLTTTTKEVSPIIIQKTGQVYDDVTLGTINQLNNLAPNLTSKYILDTGNSLKIIGGIGIINDVFNPAEPVPSSSEIGIGLSYIKNTYDSITDDFQATDELIKRLLQRNTNE